MSEYQYYEFLAVDRPLNAAQLAEVRALSTRARVTSTRFTNSYQWGDFRGSPDRMMERYYDAHLYVANWGTHRVMLRLPKHLLDLRTAQQYCFEESVQAWSSGRHVLLNLSSEDEGGDWDENAEDSLAALVGVRAELAAGDLRALYLAWLSALSGWELREDDEEEFQSEVEPPVPAGLATLSAPQRALADFLRVDPDLLAVAAEASPVQTTTTAPEGDLTRWVKALPAAEKNALLLRVVRDDDPHVRAELLRRFHGAAMQAPADAVRRTAAQLLDAAAARRTERQRLAAERRAQEVARREQQTALAREQRLTALVGRQEQSWLRVTALIDTKKPSEYDAAVGLLKDLREVGQRTGNADEFCQRLALLHQQHRRKSSLIERLNRAGLTA
ncbi:hypothetical protein [Kitasatospora sp. MAP5-34]|uniref:hypothetical protein n=1 Tax=Kitasatospora sp. MAP5-34 TaxID=3035102 RepID=UPI002475DB0D|nr:hypothetical protein [Kitasatospora sp. MAP5-34]MDH6580613.1 hypothetical protein [Kitasatospora sp. MAP5-34]